jgi:HSP20 family protein
MQMFQWNPWSLVDELERTMSAGGSAAWPAFEVIETDDETVLSADVPGMGEDDIEVLVSTPYLIVRGERTPRPGSRRAHRRFERRFFIGESYDPDEVSAHVADGELTIRLAKAARAKPRRIPLTTGRLAAKVKGLLGVGDKEKKAG